MRRGRQLVLALVASSFAVASAAHGQSNSGDPAPVSGDPAPVVAPPRTHHKVKVPPPSSFLPPPTKGGLTNGSSAGYRLTRDGRRGWVFDSPAFKARIDLDGAVHFDDNHIGVGILLPVPLALPEGTPTLEGALRGKQRARVPSTNRVDPSLSPLPRMSPNRPDPAEECVYPRPCFWDAPATLIAWVGHFDMTDELVRLQHKDPYRFQKQKFLTTTAAFRQELAQRALQRSRSLAIDELRRRLDEIDKSGRDRNQRRADLQALAADLDPNPEISGPARKLIDERLRALGVPGASPDGATP